MRFLRYVQSSVLYLLCWIVDHGLQQLVKGREEQPELHLELLKASKDSLRIPTSMSWIPVEEADLE